MVQVRQMEISRKSQQEVSRTWLEPDGGVQSRPELPSGHVEQEPSSAPTRAMSSDLIWPQEVEMVGYLLTEEEGCCYGRHGNSSSLCFFFVHHRRSDRIGRLHSDEKVEKKSGY